MYGQFMMHGQNIIKLVINI